jgi:hypothetical protein
MKGQRRLGILKKSSTQPITIITSNAKARDNFERVRSKRQKFEILRKVIDTKGEILLKFGADNICTFAATNLNEERGLSGMITKGQVAISKRGDAVIANFSLGVDKYFFQCLAIPFETHITMKVENLFLLQRRAHTRLELDENIERTAMVVQQGDKVIYANGYVVDISLGGAKVVIEPDSEPLKTGDRIKIAFHIGGRWNLEGFGFVRFYQKKEDGTQHFGFEFEEETKKLLFGRLQLMIVDLQRRSFKAQQGL